MRIVEDVKVDETWSFSSVVELPKPFDTSEIDENVDIQEVTEWCHSNFKAGAWFISVSRLSVCRPGCQANGRYLELETGRKIFISLAFQEKDDAVAFKLRWID